LSIRELGGRGKRFRSLAANEEELAAADKDEVEEARVWQDGLDRIDNCSANPAAKPRISICLDLSATPFYLTAAATPRAGRSLGL
jgi:hypothetical protein